MITTDDKKEIQELIEKAFTDRQNGNRDYYLNQRDKVDLVEKINDVKTELTEKINNVKVELTGKINDLKTELIDRINKVESSITGKLYIALSIAAVVIILASKIKW